MSRGLASFGPCPRDSTGVGWQKTSHLGGMLARPPGGRTFGWLPSRCTGKHQYDYPADNSNSERVQRRRGREWIGWRGAEAASSQVSVRVGWGWMVRATSRRVALHSMASRASPRSSPAPAPMIPASSSPPSPQSRAPGPTHSSLTTPSIPSSGPSPTSARQAAPSAPTSARRPPGTTPG